MDAESIKKPPYTFPPCLPLDNAAKIYPAARGKRSPSMFRLSMELKEDIDADILAAAVEKTLTRIPSMSQQLKRGFFWYYLKHRTDAPPVLPEINNPCVYLNEAASRGFQFRVSSYRRRVAVDFFHVLTDGTGGMSVLKTLVAEYLALKYGAKIPPVDGVLDCTQPPHPAEYEDSFFRHAGTTRLSRLETPAYRIRGKREDCGVIHITTGTLPLDAIHAKAKEYGATINELLVAVLFQVIYDIQQSENHPARKNRPVKICIPINLRRHFESRTLRNFTTYVNLSIDLPSKNCTLEEVIAGIRRGMLREAAVRKLQARFSTNVASEKSFLLKIAPLFMKNLVLRLVYLTIGDRYNSATLSNLGLVKLPDEMAPYVDRVSFMLGAGLNPVSCACVSFDNKLCFSITRTIEEPLIERAFFTALVRLGVPVTVESNQI